MWPPRLFRELLGRAMSRYNNEPRPAEKRALVVGLGNYGLRGTRHSVGMDVLNHLANKLNVAGEWKLDKRCCADVTFASLGDTELVLMKPRRFMNVNGLSVVGAVETFNLESEDVYLIHDDLDKPLGRVALKMGGSARGHNGVRSCINSLHSDSMVRLRIGIGRPVGEAAVDRYVLSRFTSAEQEILPQVFEQAVELLLKHIQEKGRSQEMPETCGDPESARLETKGA